MNKASICRHPDYELWQGLRLSVRGGWKPAGYPFILGHEFSGNIVEMGSKVNEIYPEFRVGDRICEWSWYEEFCTLEPHVRTFNKLLEYYTIEIDYLRSKGIT